MKRKPLAGFCGASRSIDDAALSAHAFDLLCLTMVATLVLHASHLPIWLSSALAAVLALRWWQRRRFATRVPLLVKLPLVALLPVLVFAQYGTLFGRAPGSALAVGLLVLKLLESERKRDARTGVAFACFALMSALLFGKGLVATVLVALALLPALMTLRALEPDTTRVAWPAELLTSARALLLALPLTLIGFLFIPRLSTPLWGAPNAGEGRTGVSGSMAPGDFTQLLVDDSPAFRVTFAHAPPPPAARYFRGPVLTWFDGHTWSTLSRRSDPRHPSITPVEPLQTDGRIYHYRVRLQSTQQHWLFALDTPIDAPQGARLTPARTILRSRQVQSTLTYRLASSATHRLGAHRLSAMERHLTLQRPEGFDPRSVALARRWRQRFGDNDAAIVKRALAMFHDQDFRYTLNPPPLDRNSVDDFLFNTRAGFCEHYASAFTFLMRAAGIPARVVAGYQGGYWNAMGDYLLVRQSDAHAWSEVWLPAHGWVRIDPTAAVRPERVDLGATAAAGDQAPWMMRGWLQRMRNHWDIVNHWWNASVNGFDALRQRGLLTRFGIRGADTATLTAALIAGTVAVLCFGLIVVLWPRRQPRDRLQVAMARLQRRLRRAGIERRPSEGPRHFFARAARHLPHERDSLRSLAEMYIRMRYMQDAASTEDVRAFLHAVRIFRPRRTV